MRSPDSTTVLETCWRRRLDACGIGDRKSGDRFVYRITKNGESPVDTHLLVIATGLQCGVEMTNASGTMSTGNPYIRCVSAERRARAGSEH
jgi:hypothetical protein